MSDNVIFIDALGLSPVATVGAGNGNDRYILSGPLLSSNEVITISDTLGSDIVQIAPNTQIVSSLATSNALSLTFSTGARVIFENADQFTFKLGGDAFTGTGGTDQAFGTFLTSSLGYVTAPTSPQTVQTGSAGTIGSITSTGPANSYISGQGGNGVTSNYNIELIFQGAFTTDQRTAFEKAADYISALITGDLPNEGMIDDIRITAVIEPGDGLGQVLGSAGPEFLRSGSLLPFSGNMTFDSFDVEPALADGTFGDTVAHEMLHALGFGTIWEADNLGLLSETAGLRFVGDNAIAAYNTIFAAIAAADANSTTGVPVETDFGEGTARGHWDEDTFTSEIMTGFGESTNFISGMTVAALEDMGYDTIFDVGVPAATMPQLSDFMFA